MRDKRATPPSRRSEEIWANFVSPAGYVLAVSYPVLALSTGVRAIYQLFFRSDISHSPASLPQRVRCLLLFDSHPWFCIPPSLDLVALRRRAGDRNRHDRDRRALEFS